MPSDISLSLIVFIPALAACLVLVLPVRSDLERFRVRTAALFGTLLSLLIAIFDLLGEVGNPSQGALPQPSLDAPWLRHFFFQMDYHLGTDGLNLMLLFGVTAVYPALVLASWRQRERYRTYFALLLLTEVALTGALATQDLLLFAIFFALPVVPLALLVAFGEDGSRAGRRVLWSQSLSVAALLAAILLMLLQSGNRTFDFLTLSTVNPVKGAPGLIVAVLMLFAFGSRMAIFPLQRWFVDGVSAAPTPVGMLLSISSLPLGTYGMVRVLLDMDPAAAIQLVVPLLALSLVTLFWGGLAARGSREPRRIVAYCLVALAGPVLLGVAAFSETSIAGALGMAFAVTLLGPLLLLVVGAVADRGGHERLRELLAAGGSSPRLQLLYAIAAASLLGVPFLAGFPAMFQILVGSFVAHRFVTALTVIGLLVLTSGVWRLGSGLFWRRDRSAGPEVAEVADAHGSEFYAGWLLAGLLIIFGISAGYFVPYTVHGTDLVAARISSYAPPPPPAGGHR